MTGFRTFTLIYPNKITLKFSFYPLGIPNRVQVHLPPNSSKNRHLMKVRNKNNKITLKISQIFIRHKNNILPEAIMLLNKGFLLSVDCTEIKF